jgi:transposase InsO family protein
VPWEEKRAVSERMRFIVAVQESEDSLAEVCRRFGVSRKTGYKWIERYEAGGPVGLMDRASTPHTHPDATPAELVDAVIEARKSHPTWGPKKLAAWLRERDAEVSWPAPSTIGALLKRHGLVRPRRRRLRVPLHTEPLRHCDRPNAVWCADFKGHAALGDKTRCYPLTITDGFSRYLLKCEGLREPTEQSVRVHFERAFREFGLPTSLRTDNGVPFATRAPGGLSELSVWWIKLGIVHERIEPGHPEQNGRHERMHRTLKEETMLPPKVTMTEQQRAFDCFRRTFNDERPHEALGMKPPSRCYVTSARPFTDKLTELVYSEDCIVRRLDEKGRLTRRSHHLPLTRLLAHEPVGLRPVEDGLWDVFFGPVLLGQLDERRRGEPILRRVS